MRRIFEVEDQVIPFGFSLLSIISSSSQELAFIFLDVFNNQNGTYVPFGTH